MDSENNGYFEADTEKSQREELDNLHEDIEEKYKEIDKDVQEKVNESIEASLDKITHNIEELKDMKNYVEKDELRSVSLSEEIVLEYKAIALKSERDSEAFKDARAKVEDLLKERPELAMIRAIAEKTQDQIKEEELKKANALKAIDDIKEIAKKLKEELLSESPDREVIAGYVDYIEQYRTQFAIYEGYITPELFDEVKYLMDDIIYNKEEYITGKQRTN